MLRRIIKLSVRYVSRPSMKNISVSELNMFHNITHVENILPPYHAYLFDDTMPVYTEYYDNDKSEMKAYNSEIMDYPYGCSCNNHLCSSHGYCPVCMS